MTNTSTASRGRLFLVFHLFTTRSEKKYSLASQQLCDFINFQQWPQVRIASASWNYPESNGTIEMHRTILNGSIQSARFLLSKSVYNFSFWSLSLYSKSFRLSKSVVKWCCTFSNNIMFFLWCGLHNGKQYSTCVRTRLLYSWTVISGYLLDRSLY